MDDPDSLVSLADLAEMADVSRPAVSNWRRRNPDFPHPVEETGATSLFRLGDLMAWMENHGKHLDPRSLDQLIWSAVNPARSALLPEEAARAGMIMLGYLALALRSDETMPVALRAAIADEHQQALGEILAILDEQAEQLGIRDEFPAKLGPAWPSASRSFLAEVFDLAQEYGVGETFEALMAAVGRGSRGEGESITPSGVADLMISLADPVSGVLIDPACGFGTLLLAASRVPTTAPLKLIGQDINGAACDVARLRMFVHDQPARIIQRDTLRDSGHPPLDPAQADLVMGDPPISMKWHPEAADTKRRMPYGVPPAGNSDFAWLQDGISRLSQDGVAIFVLGPGTLWRKGTEGEIRRNLIEAGCIHAVIALPSALYPATNLAKSLWIVSKPRQPGYRKPASDNVLLIDATRLGDRNRNKTELTESDITTISDCYWTWRDSGQLTTAGDLRAEAVPSRALLGSDANLNPARWIKDPTANPELRLERIENARRELQEARTRLSTASLAIPLLQGRFESLDDSWEIRKMTDLATIIRPRRIDPKLFGAVGVPVIRHADVGPDLTIRPSSRVNLESVTHRVEITKPGDVVVITDGAKPRAAVDHWGGAVVSSPLQVVRPRPRLIDPVILAAFITSMAPKYTVGTTIGHLDLAALEVPCPDAYTSGWLSRVLETLSGQRRDALAAVEAIDELGTELIDGLASRTIQ